MQKPVEARDDGEVFRLQSSRILTRQDSKLALHLFLRNSIHEDLTVSLQKLGSSGKREPFVNAFIGSAFKEVCGEIFLIND